MRSSWSDLASVSPYLADDRVDTATSRGTLKTIGAHEILIESLQAWGLIS
jgi:hypothetical protein